MKSFLIRNFLPITTLIILVILSFEKCQKERIKYIDKISTRSDTVWIYKTNTITTIPQMVATIRDTIETKTVEYLPSENYAELKEQYLRLKEELLAKNIYKDSIKLDSLGSVTVIDTISKNRIFGRSYKYDLKYPSVTNTVTITKAAKSRNQIYLGIEVQGNKEKVIDQINGNILLKNRRDRIFGVGVGMNFDGKINYGFQSYWKLSFRK